MKGMDTAYKSHVVGLEAEMAIRNRLCEEARVLYSDDWCCEGHWIMFYTDERMDAMCLLN